MSVSRQYHFICNKNGFSISVIEGDSMMKEVNQIHNIGPNALSYYQKTILSSMQMVNFLKPGESLGFYIDSEEPYFRFKIELSNTGTFRTLLLPEEFENFPDKITGKVRLVKIYNAREPYHTILELKDHDVGNIVNEVISKSYQTNSRIILSEHGNSSLMVTKLPPSNINKKIEDFDDLSLDQIQNKYHKLIQAALLIPNADVKMMDDLFQAEGLQYLGSKEVKFFCPCSHERMVENLFTLPEHDRIDIFKEDSSIEIRCDYCNTIYNIQRSELDKNIH